jgi:N-acylneuraminate cytidylyltransferase|tara:strand:- start:153 stop:839 length:687 start_codon:yes stop_codon:yes gene_type:complete
MNNLCIIPARGGSKRIPKKNIKSFLGKPIIAYSIEAAIQSKLFTEIMVSTDCQETADIALRYGAKVPFLRSKENSNDFATTYDVIKEIIDEYKKDGVNFENICCIYACAPFVTANNLKHAYQELSNKQVDTIFPIIEYSFPIQRAVKIHNEKIELFNIDHLNTRSQDLEKSYHDAGQFYWMKSENILNKGRIITDNCSGIIITELEGQDIDNEIDWELAELKFKLLKK